MCTSSVHLQNIQAYISPFLMLTQFFSQIGFKPNSVPIQDWSRFYSFVSSAWSCKFFKKFETHTTRFIWSAHSCESKFFFAHSIYIWSELQFLCFEQNNTITFTHFTYALKSVNSGFQVSMILSPSLFHFPPHFFDFS